MTSAHLIFLTASICNLRASPQPHTRTFPGPHSCSLPSFFSTVEISSKLKRGQVSGLQLKQCKAGGGVGSGEDLQPCPARRPCRRLDRASGSLRGWSEVGGRVGRPVPGSGTSRHVDPSGPQFPELQSFVYYFQNVCHVYIQLRYHLPTISF